MSYNATLLETPAEAKSLQSKLKATPDKIAAEFLGVEADIEAKTCKQYTIRPSKRRGGKE